MIKEGEIDKNVVERGVVHFSIGESFGALITDMAREKAWYGCQRAEGILFLMRGLGGIDMETAEKVVDGKLKLVTNDDHKTLHEEKDTWTPPDFKAMEKEIEAMLEEAREMTKHDQNYHRHLFLTDHERDEIGVEIHDIEYMVKQNIWKALEQANRLKPLILDWHNQGREDLRLRFRKPSRDDDELPEPMDLLDQLKKDTKARIESMPMDPEMKERMLRLTDSQFHDPDIKEDPKFEYDTGWLDRDGHYFSCEMGLHIALAGKLFEQFFPIIEGETNLQKAKNAEGWLEEQGWMKCTGRHWYTTEKPPTEAQIRAFKKWCERWPEYTYNGTKYGGPGGVEE